MIYLFDIDGTLADCRHRKHWIESEPKNWDAFLAGCVNDACIHPVMQIFITLKFMKFTCLLVSGRSEGYRKETADWMAQMTKGIWPADHFNPILYMRSEGDRRCDTLVKKELLAKIQDDYTGIEIAGVFDDRPKVIRMWQKMGIYTFDVSQGCEDF